MLPVTSLASFAVMYILFLYLLLHLLNLNINISARSVVINIRGISKKKYGRRYTRGIRRLGQFKFSIVNYSQSQGARSSLHSGGDITVCPLPHQLPGTLEQAFLRSRDCFRALLDNTISQYPYTD